MPQAARVGDMHTCPMQTPGVPPIPHVGGPLLPPGAPSVIINGLPAVVVTGQALCVGPPDMVAKGSMTVKIQGMPVARMGDTTAHGGVIIMGSPNVIIGDGAGGGDGGGAAGVSSVQAGLIGAAEAALNDLLQAHIRIAERVVQDAKRVEQRAAADVKKAEQAVVRTVKATADTVKTAARNVGHAIEEGESYIPKEGREGGMK